MLRWGCSCAADEVIARRQLPVNNAHIRLGKRTGQPEEVPTNNSNMTPLLTLPWGAGGDAERLKLPVVAQQSNITAPCPNAVVPPKLNPPVTPAGTHPHPKQPCPPWQVGMGFKTHACIQSPGKHPLILLYGSATHFWKWRISTTEIFSRGSYRSLGLQNTWCFGGAWVLLVPSCGPQLQQGSPSFAATYARSRRRLCGFFAPLHDVASGKEENCCYMMSEPQRAAEEPRERVKSRIIQHLPRC